MPEPVPGEILISMVTSINQDLHHTKRIYISWLITECVITRNIDGAAISQRLTNPQMYQWLLGFAAGMEALKEK